MKKIAIATLAVVVLALGAFAVFRFAGSPAQADTTPSAEAAQEPAPAAQDASDRVVVDGRVVPALRSDLSLPASGVVAELLVAEGDQVQAGQPLLRLQAMQQAAAVDQAMAQLNRAQARLAELKVGARAQEVAAATAALDAAQARLDRIEKGALPAELASAQAALAEAQATLQGVLEGASRQQIIAAEADLANAEALRRQAQAAYDRVAGNPDIGARPEAAQLEQATNAVNAALARLNDLREGATASSIAAARARVQRAQAQLDLLTATNPADVAEAQATVRQAQAQIDLLAAGNRPETIAVAEADVQAAAAAVAQAEAALRDAELRAPFAGTIAALDVAIGEPVAAGSPVIRLANLAQWQIETEDLTEFDVIDLQPGDKVTITFDAIPGLQKDGVINRIRPIGQDNRGDIVYTLVIDPAQHDGRLLWNMTAVVTIE
jgi:multidrug efflux pump subunit AcrA (membrane-fusion protein)